MDTERMPSESTDPSRCWLTQVYQLQQQPRARQLASHVALYSAVANEHTRCSIPAPAPQSRAGSASSAAGAAGRVLSAEACRSLGLVTAELTCAEVDGYFASHGTPAGDCRAQYGALGCCEALLL